MKVVNTIKPRQLAVHIAIAITVATATAAGVALAGRSGDRSPNINAANAPVSMAAAPDPIAAAARTALDRLVARGAINQSQADAIEQDVIAGSIDPHALVSDGLVTERQMQTVGAALDQVKRSAGY